MNTQQPIHKYTFHVSHSHSHVGSSKTQAVHGEHSGAGGERGLARVHGGADAGGEGPGPRHVVRRQVGGRPLLLQEGKGMLWKLYVEYIVDRYGYGPWLLPKWTM